MPDRLRDKNKCTALLCPKTQHHFALSYALAIYSYLNPVLHQYVFPGVFMFVRNVAIRLTPHTTWTSLIVWTTLGRLPKSKVYNCIHTAKNYNLSLSVWYLTPLRGQFEAAFKLNPAAAPPLSETNTMIELSNILTFCKASTTRPTDSSNSCSIPRHWNK